MTGTGAHGQLERADLGRYQLAYRSAGTGQPAIVLEAGSGCDQAAWSVVFDRLAEFTGVLSYDRVNLGASDRTPAPSPGLRSCQDAVRDLHDLLAIARIGRPYVLVGHSGGAHIVRVYARQFPNDVVGIVLVDAAHHDQNARTLELMPPASPDDSDTLIRWREALTRGYTDETYADPEGFDVWLSDAQAREAGDLGDLPLVVLTAPHNEAPPADLPADFMAAYNRMFHELQCDLARLSTRGTHILAEHSGHFIQIDEPDLVVAAVRQVVNLARASERAGEERPAQKG